MNYVTLNARIPAWKAKGLYNFVIDCVNTSGVELRALKLSPEIIFTDLYLTIIGNEQDSRNFISSFYERFSDMKVEETWKTI